jgi:hypothetical protein
MAGAGTKGGDEALIAALAAGASPAAAAGQAKVSARTVFRRLADPEFRRRVDDARAELLERAVGRLTAVGVLAGDRLFHLLQNASSQAVQLGAARAVLDFMFQGAQVHTLVRAVEDLRRQVEELSRGHGDTAAGAGEAQEPGGRAPGGDAEQSPRQVAG